jgi:signal transduction histidine kinase
MGTRPTHGLTPRQAVALAVAAGAAVTLVSVVPLTSVAYRSLTFHVAIETAAMLIALLAAALLIGRFFRAPAESELILAASLLLLGLTNLCFSVIPWVADEQLGSFDTWAPITGRLIGAAGLAIAPFAPTDRLQNAGRAAARMLAGVVAVLVVIGVAAAVMAPHLPVGIDPDLPPDPSGIDLVGKPTLLVMQLIALLLYSIAAIGFARRAERTGDELMSCLAAAMTVAAFSRLNYFLFPSLNSEWVYTGDFLRLATYVLMLAGALREITGYQHDLAEVAVYRERRRIARELHDGLAQELAFIISRAHQLAAEREEPATHIARAAERALGESRHAIATLARPIEAGLDSSVAQAAQEVAARERVSLELDLEPGVVVDDAVHDAFMRIVREAVSNAIRHGHARSVRVRLARADELVLCVEDDGVGLGDGPGPGFGLISMRERAHALGGTLDVAPRRPHGVRVEVRLP